MTDRRSETGAGGYNQVEAARKGEGKGGTRTSAHRAHRGLLCQTTKQASCSEQRSICKPIRHTQRGRESNPKVRNVLRMNTPNQRCTVSEVGKQALAGRCASGGHSWRRRITGERALGWPRWLAVGGPGGQFAGESSPQAVRPVARGFIAAVEAEFI